MDIRELEKLAVWYGEHFDRIGPLYQALIAPIQHNAKLLIHHAAATDE
jgi:hypothetical protein